MDAMRDDFQKLKEAGINTVAGLVKWMVDAKIIDDAMEARRKAEQMFNDVSDRSNVEFDKFVQVVTALVNERKQNTEQAVTQLVGVLSAGITAFVNAVKTESQRRTP